MSNKIFQDLSDNTIFKMNGLEFKKIPAVKISCCRSINAEQTDNANQRIFVKPDTEVEVND